MSFVVFVFLCRISVKWANVVPSRSSKRRHDSQAQEAMGTGPGEHLNPELRVLGTPIQIGVINEHSHLRPEPHSDGATKRAAPTPVQ